MAALETEEQAEEERQQRIAGQQRRIEQRAFEIWQREGYPRDKYGEHWLRAVREISDEE